MTDATTSANRRTPPRGRVNWLLARRTRVLLLVVALAVAVRVVTTVVIVRDEPEIHGDMKSYHQFASAIAEGGWWDRHVSYREPGYPLFVAGVYAVTGGSQLAARLANALLGALTCLGMYSLARRVFGAGVGLAAAAWFAVYFQSVQYSAYLLRESLVSLLLVVFLVALFDAARGHRGKAVLAALWYLALVHTDARFIFHAPFLLLFLLLAGGGWKRGLTTSAVLFAVFAVGMLPWLVRNYQVYGRIVVVNTRTLVVEAPWRDYSDAAPVDGIEPAPADAREGVRRLTGARAALYDLTEFYRVFRFRGEVRNNSNAFEKPWSWFHNLSSIVMYGALVPFIVIGFWDSLRRRMTPAYILALPVLAHTVLHVIKWGLPRYRIPIEPLLIIVAFYGVAVVFSHAPGRFGDGVVET